MPLLLDILAPILDAEPEPTRTEILLELLNSNPVLGWGIAIFVVLAMAVAAVATLTGNLGSIIDFFRNYLFPKPREITEEQRRRLRQQLLLVLKRQVSTRLHDSLHNLVRIDIEREEQRQRVGRSNLPLIEEEKAPLSKNWMDKLKNRLFLSLGSKRNPEELKETTPTLEFFNRPDVQGRLLILGEPGAGKTTELLGLAQDLIIQAQENSDCPIPVIFEATNWKDSSPFEDWLVAQLEVQYQLPRQVAQFWIETNWLLPLLDGLDELGLAGQVECIEAVNEYLSEHLASPMVVCCRREEYEQGAALLEQLNGAVYLQPVTDEQIQQYFKELNRERLWASIQADSEISRLARSPLFLTMLVVAYQGQPIHTAQELLDVYIDRQLRDVNNQGAYFSAKAPSQHQTEHYLGWLAIKLNAQGATEFLIEQLQPRWLDRGIDKELYRLLFSLTSCLILGLTNSLACGLIFNPAFGPVFSPVLGPVFGLFFGPVFGLFMGLSISLLFSLSIAMNDIKSVERVSFSWEKALSKALAAVLVLGSVLGLSFGLLIGITAGLSFGLSFGLLSGVTAGLLTGVASGLFLGVLRGLLEGLTPVELQIDNKRFPNQGIKGSLRIAIVFSLLGGLIISLLSGLFAVLFSRLMVSLLNHLPISSPNGPGSDLPSNLFFGPDLEQLSNPLFILSFGLGFGLFSALFLGLLFGLISAIRHFCLRFVLHRSGVAPWNYERFLKHAENHRFIQRVGGRYRFVHDLLRKRFAERYRG